MKFQSTITIIYVFTLQTLLYKGTLTVAHNLSFYCFLHFPLMF